ncbi:hypothetical protein LCGC14_0135230 [marine sediment metagenome]|uniref:Uncharacterized protein n=1 Tax=marine sediment metagenome TaxID=412755 RepID=A0A0F9VHY2_9ZZZZ
MSPLSKTKFTLGTCSRGTPIQYLMYAVAQNAYSIYVLWLTQLLLTKGYSPRSNTH